MLPYVSFQANTIVSMLPQESQPHLHSLRVSILYLDKSPQSNALKILLAFLKDEVTTRDRPAFSDSR